RTLATNDDALSRLRDADGAGATIVGALARAALALVAVEEARLGPAGRVAAVAALAAPRAGVIVGVRPRVRRIGRELARTPVDEDEALDAARAQRRASVAREEQTPAAVVIVPPRRARGIARHAD